MQIDPNQPDEALDNILSALRHAAPPEEMHTRIAQRLQHARAHSPAPSRIRSFLLGVTPSASWTRGALTGAALAAAIILCALPLIRKTSTPPPSQTIAPIAMQSTHRTATNVNLTNERTIFSVSHTAPCVKPATAPIPTLETASTPSHYRSEISLRTIAPSHPAPPLPLTPQERQLVRLVRTASPAQLAAFNPENEAKRDAEEAANFQKFFAPPPPPPGPNANPETPANSVPMLN